MKCESNNGPIFVNALGIRINVVRGKETVEVHDAAGRAGPQERVLVRTPSGCRTVSPPHLLIAGNATSGRLCKSTGIKVHDAAGRAGPQKRVPMASGCRTITESDLPTAGDAVSGGSGNSAW